MRRLLVPWLCLTLSCLAVTGCAAGVARKKSKAAAPQVSLSSENKPAPARSDLASAEKKTSPFEKKDSTPTWTVEGWGKSEEDAKKFAVIKVCEKVKASLDPPLQWTPPDDFVLKNLITGEAQRRPEQDTEINGEKVQCWAWTVRLPAAQVKFMRDEDAKFRADLAAKARSELAESRMLELGKLEAWLVVAFAGLWLLLRVVRPRGGG